MPALTPKQLDDYPDVIRFAWEKAIATPMLKVVVLEGVAEKQANYIHARLKSARQGMRKFYPREHMYFRASEAGRLQIRKDKYPLNRELWNVTVWFEGIIKRPSEEADEAFQLWKKGLRSTPF